jgi:hypothetical protein
LHVVATGIFPDLFPLALLAFGGATKAKQEDAGKPAKTHHGFDSVHDL